MLCAAATGSGGIPAAAANGKKRHGGWKAALWRVNVPDDPNIRGREKGVRVQILTNTDAAEKGVRVQILTNTDANPAIGRR
jgi:hypothetical protein